jgi:hypothetical protein
VSLLTNKFCTEPATYNDFTTSTGTAAIKRKLGPARHSEHISGSGLSFFAQKQTPPEKRSESAVDPRLEPSPHQRQAIDLPRF